MVLGISKNVFACFGNSMIESIMADQIIRSKELEDITKKEMTKNFEKEVKKWTENDKISDKKEKYVKKTHQENNK